MAEVTVRHLVNMCVDLLNDDGNDYWQEADLVDFYNRASSAVVNLKPEANAVVKTWKLSSGITQSIPSRGNVILDITRNMGVDGLTPGAGVTKTIKELLSAYAPSWPSETEEDEVRNWAQITPKRFVVYPPNDGTGYIEGVISETPEQVLYDEDGDWETELVSVGDQYVTSVFYYMMHLANCKDSDFPGDESRARHYYSLALNELGVGQNQQQQQGG